MENQADRLIVLQDLLELRREMGDADEVGKLEAMGFLQIIMAALGRTRYESGFTLLE